MKNTTKATGDFQQLNDKRKAICFKRKAEKTESIENSELLLIVRNNFLIYVVVFMTSLSILFVSSHKSFESFYQPMPMQ